MPLRLLPGRSSRFAPKTRRLEWVGLGVAAAGVVLLFIGSQDAHRSWFGFGVFLFLAGAVVMVVSKIHSRWIALREASGWLASEVAQRQRDQAGTADPKPADDTDRPSRS